MVDLPNIRDLVLHDQDIDLDLVAGTELTLGDINTGLSAGGADPITVDALEVASASDVRVLTGDGPPDSSTAPGVAGYVDTATPGVYVNTSGDLNIPVWEAVDAAGGVDSARAPGPIFDPPAGMSTGTDHWFVQYALDVDLGFYVVLFQGDGFDGWGGSDPPIGGTIVTGNGAPINAADATGSGVAGQGSVYVDRTTPGQEGWWHQVGPIDAPFWSPAFAAMEQPFGANNNLDITSGSERLINATFPTGTTYAQVRSAFVATSTPDGAAIVGLPFSEQVRIGALFAHVLSPAAMAAGVRLTWDEIQYLFYADKPAANVLTGEITYTELDDADTILEDSLAQLLVIGYS